MKQQFREYFSFSRKERIGILILILLILGVGVMPSLMPANTSNDDSAELSDFRQQLAMLELPSDTARPGQHYTKESESYAGNHSQTERRNFRQAPDYGNPGVSEKALPGELFYFDPNTLPAEEWRRLGVRDKTVSTIQNYLAKGGSFRKPEDLLKVYGLSERQKTALLPFVRIKETPKPEYYPPKQEKTESYSSRYPAKLPPVRLDINLADSSAWQRLPGIGHSLSSRIVRFRDRLGGFADIQQLKDVYGIHDTVFQKIEQWLFLESPPRRIQLNEVSVADLAVHPYCGNKLAKVIIDFRNLHGPFKQIADLKQLASLSPGQYSRLIPYLEIN